MELKKYGGRLIKGYKNFDGKEYKYRSVWNSDEEIDTFLEAEGIKSSARDIQFGYLTLWFTP